MSIKDVVHQVVLKSPGGIRAYAARVGVPESTMKSKLNPNCETHHTYIEDLELIIELLGDQDIARYVSQISGGFFVKSHTIDDLSDAALLDLVLERDKRMGEYSGCMRRALEDGGIDEKEFKELMRRFDAVSEAREQVRQRIRQIHEQTLERAGRLNKLKAV